METRTTHKVTKEVDLFGKNKFTSLTEHLLFEPIAVDWNSGDKATFFNAWGLTSRKSTKLQN